MSAVNTYVGEILALVCAMTWAVAVIFFKKSGETVHPIGLNLFKDILAIALLTPTIYLFGETLLHPAPAGHYILLLLSGALGIGIADTLFLKSLNALGAGLSAIVVCMYSPFIIALSFLYLGEALNLMQFIGVALILIAVLAATVRWNSAGVERRSLFAGILWGVLSQAANAVGVVAIKPVLDISPIFWVTEIRLIGGVAALAVILAFHSSRRMIIRSIASTGSWGYTIAGSFAGAYLAMLLWLGGMKFAQASVASALNQTSTIFIFLLAAVFLRERVTVLRAAGIALGFSGALLVTFG